MSMNSDAQPPIGRANRTAKLTRIIGDDYYDLKMTSEAIMELEEATERGGVFVLKRMAAIDPLTRDYMGDFSVKWIMDIIRIALVHGGSMQPRESVRFVDRHLREGFVMDYHEIAIETLSAGLFGGHVEPIEEEASEEGEPQPEEVSPTPSASSNGANSIEPVERPD